VRRDGIEAVADQHFPDFWWRQALSRGPAVGTSALAVLAALWGVAWWSARGRPDVR
jgi:hypothetical protein